jgi:hypothetical protein
MDSQENYSVILYKGVYKVIVEIPIEVNKESEGKHHDI